VRLAREWPDGCARVGKAFLADNAFVPFWCSTGRAYL